MHIVYCFCKTTIIQNNLYTYIILKILFLLYSKQKNTHSWALVNMIIVEDRSCHFNGFQHYLISINQMPISLTNAANIACKKFQIWIVELLLEPQTKIKGLKCSSIILILYLTRMMLLISTLHNSTCTRITNYIWIAYENKITY